ncbi:MAG: hypothetical protein WC284_07775 [Candidimonas sp.]
MIHFEDLTLSEIKKLSDTPWVISEKIDGTGIEFIHDGEVIAIRRGKKYTINDWPYLCWTRDFRYAHEWALKHLKCGDHTYAEIVLDGHPNVIKYDQKCKIVITKTNRIFENESEIEIDTPSSINGSNLIDTKYQRYCYAIQNEQIIINSPHIPVYSQSYKWIDPYEADYIKLNRRDRKFSSQDWKNVKEEIRLHRSESLIWKRKLKTKLYDQIKTNHNTKFGNNDIEGFVINTDVVRPFKLVIQDDFLKRKDYYRKWREMAFKTTNLDELKSISLNYNEWIDGDVINFNGHDWSTEAHRRTIETFATKWTEINGR